MKNTTRLHELERQQKELTESIATIENNIEGYEQFADKPGIEEIIDRDKTLLASWKVQFENNKTKISELSA